MRPYCTGVARTFPAHSRPCDNDGGPVHCDGCRLEAACNAMGIGLALAGLAAMFVRAWSGVKVTERYAREVIAARAGIVLP